MICVSSDCILPEYNGSACAEIACVHRSCPQLLQNLFLHLPCAFDPAAGLCGKAVIAEPVCTRNSGAYHVDQYPAAAPGCILPHTVRVCAARHAKELRCATLPIAIRLAHLQFYSSLFYRISCKMSSVFPKIPRLIHKFRQKNPYVP